MSLTPFKSMIVVLFAFALGVNAQLLSDLPACAQPCFNMTQSDGGCPSFNDISCMCPLDAFGDPRIVSCTNVKCATDADANSATKIIEAKCDQSVVSAAAPSGLSSSSSGSTILVPAGSSISIGYTFKSASASVTSSSQVSRTTITPTDIAPNRATSINIGDVALFAAGIAGILFGLQLVV